MATCESRIAMLVIMIHPLKPLLGFSADGTLPDK
jgi:hypothetical protein